MLKIKKNEKIDKLNPMCTYHVQKNRNGENMIQHNCGTVCTKQMLQHI